jgi:hypothetical protein
MRFKGSIIGIIVVSSAFSWITFSSAEDEVYRIKIKDHRFIPNELTIPAGRKVKILVENQDPAPEEFESYDLRREKVVSGSAEIILYVGPLKEGRYPYLGDFHAATAKGVIVASPAEGKN